jgi:hypothetical protein
MIATASAVPHVHVMSHRSMTIAAVSTVVEWYDFTLYLYFATVLARVFFGPGPDALAATFGGFAVAYLIRPLGALAFGHIGDRIGRRPMMLMAMALMAGAMLATALLPTRAAVGPAAGGLLIALRCLMSFSVGGEYNGVVAYLVEGAAPARRGFHRFAGSGGKRSRRATGGRGMRVHCSADRYGGVGKLGLADPLLRRGRASRRDPCGARDDGGVARVRAPNRGWDRAGAALAARAAPPPCRDRAGLCDLGAGVDHLLCGHHLRPGLPDPRRYDAGGRGAVAVDRSGGAGHRGDAICRAVVRPVRDGGRCCWDWAWRGWWCRPSHSC